MTTYLGETAVELKDTPFAKHTPTDWAMAFISQYGQIDGSHHKTWVLDQVARILKGTPMVVVHAKWSDGQSEYRFCTDETPSPEYTAWIKEMLGEELDEDEFEYSYDEGIAP